MRYIHRAGWEGGGELREGRVWVKKADNTKTREKRKVRRRNGRENRC